MGFDFPQPPDHLVFPQTAQDIANIAMGALVVACLAYSLLEWRRGRGPLALVLLVGGAVSFLNEPILDVLGPLWHPRPGQDVAIDTFGPAPLWGLFIYTVFFGTGTYAMYRMLGAGISRRHFWIGVGAFFAVNLAVELPLLAAEVYVYYGYDDPPMMVGGLPLYWLIINAGGPLVAACALLAAPAFFAGWGMLRAVLLPMTAYAGYSLACGWPIFSAQRVEDLPEVLEWGAALLTIAIGATIFHELAGWAERRARGAGAAAAEAPPSGAPAPAGGAAPVSQREPVAG